jgi:hypothetical protein
VPWASQLAAPNVGDVRKALREVNPAALSVSVPASSSARMSGATGESCTATRP